MFFSLRLRAILFVAFAVVAVVPILITGWGVYQPAFDREKAAVSEKHLLMAQELAIALHRYASDVEAIFRFAVLQGIADASTDELTELLHNVHIRDMFITDYAGNIEQRVIRTSVNAPAQMPAEAMGSIRTALPTAADKLFQVIFTEVLPGLGGEPTIYLIMPLPEELLAIGVLGTNYMVALQESIVFGEGGHAAIVDHKGKVLSHPNKDWTATMKDLSMVAPVKEMIAGETGSIIFFSPAVQQDMVAGYTTVASVGWGAMVPQPLSELERSARSLSSTILKIGGLGVLVSAGLGWAFAAYLVRPIVKVNEAARRFATENLQAPLRLSKSAPWELRSLAASFNIMVDTISGKNKALEKQSAFLQATLDNMGEGVSVISKDRNLVLFNKEFVDLFNLSATSLHVPMALSEVVQIQAGHLHLQRESDDQGLSSHDAQSQLFELMLFLGQGNRHIAYQAPDGRFIEHRTAKLPDGGYINSYVDITSYKRLEQSLQVLHQMSTASHLSFPELAQTLLHTGCQHFNLPIGMLTRVSKGRCYVIQAVTPDNTPTIEPGVTFNLGHSCCYETLRASDLVDYTLTPNSVTPINWVTHPGFPEHKLQRYVGIAVKSGSETYGMLELFSLDPLQQTMKSTDQTLLKLMAQWVMSEIVKQRARRAQEALQAIPDAVLTTNEHGTIVYLNAKAEATLGGDKSKVLGKRLDHLLKVGSKKTPEDTSDVLVKYFRHHDTNTRTKIPIRLRRFGQSFTLEGILTSLKDQDHVFHGIMLIMRNVT